MGSYCIHHNVGTITNVIDNNTGILVNNIKCDKLDIDIIDIMFLKNFIL